MSRRPRRNHTPAFKAKVALAATGLDPAVVGAAGLLQLSRDHWQIENSLFHVRDVTFREDHCRVRSGSAPTSAMQCWE